MKRLIIPFISAVTLASTVVGSGVAHAQEVVPVEPWWSVYTRPVDNPLIHFLEPHIDIHGNPYHRTVVA
jgi:hypothetical protein